MGDLQKEKVNFSLLEVLADIAYFAGYYKLSSGDSRNDISIFIYLAKQFEKQHENTCWEEVDYILSIDKFILENILIYITPIED